MSSPKDLVRVIFPCFLCNKKVDTLSLSLQRTHLCDDCYMRHGIKVPSEFWKGDTAQQQGNYMTESGECIVCNRKTTKQCKLCFKWNCRPTEWSGDCMENHLRNFHGIYFKE